MIIRVLLAGLFTASFGLATAAASPLRDGERLEFRVAWGIFAHAGDIVVSADDEEIEGIPHTRVVTETSTRGLVRALYPFDGRVESVFDRRDGRLMAAFARTTTRRRETRASIVFDYRAGVAQYVDAFRPERSTTLRIPEGQPMDLITSLISTRFWKVQPGDRRPIAVLFDDEFYELIVAAEGVERVATAKGRQPALKLVPRMETEPKGMFRRGGSVRVWLSTDDRRLPVRLEVSVKVGTATALLTEYTPPARSVAATAPRTSQAAPRPRPRAPVEARPCTGAGPRSRAAPRTNPVWRGTIRPLCRANRDRYGFAACGSWSCAAAPSAILS